jgi:hypothetical protein
MLAAHYSLLSPAGCPHDYLPEEMVLDRKASLSEYTVLVLPYAPFMTEAFSRQLTGWVQRGGTLVAVGPFAVQDESGRCLPAESSLFRTLFPELRKEGRGDWDYGPAGAREPAMAVRPYGKGSLIYLNRPVDVFGRNPALAEPLAKLLARTAPRTAFAPCADLEIAVRDKPGGEKYLCLCNRNVETPLETTVTVQGAYRQALDVQIPGWFPVPAEVSRNQTLLKVRLDPGDFTLILLKP